MKYTPSELWDFLRQNGVKRIRLKGDDYEFLMTNEQVIQPVALFDYLSKRIGKKRPQKIIIGHRPRFRRHHWTVDIDSSFTADRMEAVKGFKSDEDKKMNDLCNKETEGLNQRWNDLKQLFILVRFGEEKIPSDLEVTLKSLPDKALTRRKVALADAKMDISKLVKKFYGKKQKIDICREYLIDNEIIGKPNYTPEQLSNAVAKYIDKLRNRQQPST